MKPLLTFFFILLGNILVFSQLTVKINSIPTNSPADTKVFIAGDFTSWEPGDSSFELKKNQDGAFEITFNPNPGTLEFKFTRGTWSTVEGNQNGGFRPNRTLQYTGDSKTFETDILSWEDVGGTNSTAAYNVSLMDDAFPIPQLDRERKVWIYLPPDYDTSQKRYPVLYMLDGQNVFDAATSFAGEWGVDEALNFLFDFGDHGCIVVAVENGGANRLNEYSPWINSTYGGGEGELFMDFMVNNLKPHIDSNYRTRSGRDYTGLMGSSMGGLIALYGGIEYPEVYSKIGSFSPAYWFSDSTFMHVEDKGRQFPARIYTIVGQTESSVLVDGVLEMDATLRSEGFKNNELVLLSHPNGSHSEAYWASEFVEAYRWLFRNLFPVSTQENGEIDFGIFPNPSKGVFGIKNFEQLNISRVEIISNEGRILKTLQISSPEIDLRNFENGVYNLRFLKGDQVIWTEKVVLAK